MTMDAEHSKLAVKQVEQLVNQAREQRERFAKLWNKVERFGAKVGSSEKQPEQPLWSIVPLSQIKPSAVSLYIGREQCGKAGVALRIESML